MEKCKEIYIIIFDLRSTLKSLEPSGVHFLSTFDEWCGSLCAQRLGIRTSFGISFFARKDPLPEQNMWLIYEFVGGKAD